MQLPNKPKKPRFSLNATVASSVCFLAVLFLSAQFCNEIGYQNVLCEKGTLQTGDILDCYTSGTIHFPNITGRVVNITRDDVHLGELKWNRWYYTDPPRSGLWRTYYHFRIEAVDSGTNGVEYYTQDGSLHLGGIAFWAVTFAAVSLLILCLDHSVPCCPLCYHGIRGNEATTVSKNGHLVHLKCAASWFSVHDEILVRKEE